MLSSLQTVNDNEMIVNLCIFPFRQKRWEKRRERRIALRKRTKMLKDLREKKEKEAERERYRNILEPIDNPITTTSHFTTQKR